MSNMLSPPPLPHDSLERTPALVPSSSSDINDVSPAFTLLESPPLLPEEVLDIGQPALSSPDFEAAKVSQTPPRIVEPLPECWGHRGASSTFPENTRASFLEACKQGADGIETGESPALLRPAQLIEDIHITSDNVLVLFHDPKLDRTTNGSGRIRDQPWHGVLEHLRTIQTPVQPIPLFTDVLDILMMEENRHVKLNLDCKVDNDATKLFTLVKGVVESYPNWKEDLAPRIVLGLWHPKFLKPASQILPYLPRYCITMSLTPLKPYFWNLVHGFSIYYPLLASPDGQRFLADCQSSGKKITCWTVNTKEGMRDCVRWKVNAIITDKPALWQSVKRQVEADRKAALRPTLQTYLAPWMDRKAWWFDIAKEAKKEHEYLEKEGGRFEDYAKLDGDVEGLELPRSVVLV